MKKYLSIIIVAIVVVTLTGCDKAKIIKGKKKEKIEVSFSEFNRKEKYTYQVSSTDIIKVEEDKSESKKCEFNDEKCSYNKKFFITGLK